MKSARTGKAKVVFLGKEKSDVGERPVPSRAGQFANTSAATPLGRLAETISTSPVMQARTAAVRSAFGTALRPNLTGLPDALKAGVETASGLSMADVRVTRNSRKPAQLRALAFAQGTEIHLGPGQEKHLQHEAWHVAQQKQGRVKPTLQMKGVAINDDDGLEREAQATGRGVAREPSQRGESHVLITPRENGSTRSSVAQLVGEQAALDNLATLRMHRGNRRQSIGSVEEGQYWNHFKVVQARKDYGALIQKITSEVKDEKIQQELNTTFSAYREEFITRLHQALGSGHCDEFASAVATHLEKNTQGQTVRKVYFPGVDHVVVVTESQNGKQTVVDAWDDWHGSVAEFCKKWGLPPDVKFVVKYKFNSTGQSIFGSRVGKVVDKVIQQYVDNFEKNYRSMYTLQFPRFMPPDQVPHLFGSTTDMPRQERNVEMKVNNVNSISENKDYRNVRDKEGDVVMRRN